MLRSVQFFGNSRFRQAIPFLMGVLLLSTSALAQNVDQVFAKFLAATAGWQDLSFTTSMSTNMMGRSMSMQSRISMDHAGRTFQEILSGPMRVATVVRGDTIQTKDLQTGKIDSRVVPGGGRAAMDQMDPGSRLDVLRRGNRFQVESLTDAEIVVKGSPVDKERGYQAVRISFANESGMPQWCEIQDSSGHTDARMEFWWERHGSVQVMKQMKLVTTPAGKAQGVVMTMSMSGIRVNSGLNPAIFRLREGL